MSTVRTNFTAEDHEIAHEMRVSLSCDYCSLTEKQMAGLKRDNEHLIAENQELRKHFVTEMKRANEVIRWHEKRNSRLALSLFAAVIVAAGLAISSLTNSRIIDQYRIEALSPAQVERGPR